MKRTRGVDTHRDERVRMVAAEIQKMQSLGKHGVLPVSVFSRLVSQNRALLDRRPDPAVDRVTLNTEAIAEYESAAALVDNVDLGLKGLPTLGKLMRAQLANLDYVRFASILATLEKIVRILRVAVEDEHQKDTILTWLYVSENLAKSNLWFSAHLWMASQLPALVDFVLTNRELHFYDYGECFERYGFKRHRILYVDDGTFSGEQFAANMESLFDYWPATDELEAHSFATQHHQTIMAVPLLGFATQTAIQFIEAKLEDLAIRVVWLASPVKTDPRLALIDPVLFKNLQDRMRDAMLPESQKLIADQCLQKLKRQEIEHGFLTGAPLIVCEHKMADSTSIEVEFLLKPCVPLNTTSGRVLDTPLIKLGGKSPSKETLDELMNGSSAFYKSLQWQDTDKVVRMMPLQVALASAAKEASTPMCSTCGAEASRMCGHCRLAWYCSNNACQATHWQTLDHGRVCPLAAQSKNADSLL